ncbi:MAG: hypothetical protein R3F61_03160 [Myxococcota bacterium]
MHFLPPELASTLAAQGTWLSGSRAEEARNRIELLLSWLPEPVQALVVDQLIADPQAARAMLQAIALASTAGATATGVYGEGIVAMRDHQGQPFALTVLAWTTGTHPNGEPDDVARLTALLDGTFQGRQYALYLRRAVPPGFNPGPVSRAVQLWLAAIDRGEWKGRHAIYEDDEIALELTLVQQHTPRGGGRVMTVGPVTALERLAAVDTLVVDLVQRHASEEPEVPMVVALSAQPAWRVPRGYVEQLLYGTADWTVASTTARGRTYTAQFQANGRSLFSDPVCSNLAGLWWLEGLGSDPMAFRAWAHDNPWCDSPERIPTIDVPRFVAQSGHQGSGRVLTWSQPVPSWRPA